MADEGCAWQVELPELCPVVPEVGAYGARTRPTYEAIGAEVRASPVVNSDQTGAGRWDDLVALGLPDPTTSYHLIRPSRGADVVTAFLGEAHPEAWGSDVYGSQLAAPAAAHQVCLSHQIRDLTYAEEADGPLGQRWAREPRHVLGRAIRLHRLRIERAAERLTWGQPRGRGEAWRLQRRYRKHRDRRFVFLHHEDVEPTNNGSERDLRNSVIHDKVAGGYRSARGGAGRDYGLHPHHGPQARRQPL